MKLENKIDFVAFISVTNANPNGDPLNGNIPRTDFEGYGEISDVCIKRKIRNRMQSILEKPGSVFVQSEELADDGMKSLAQRAKETLGKPDKKTDRDEYIEKACEQWVDVRSFGQVFAFSDKSGFSAGVRGPVSVHLAVSAHPIEINSMQITKSVNGTKDSGKDSDTMGMKHFVRYGLYKVKGSINPQLAEKTGFSEEDAELIKECLRTLFVNDASAARPDGSMEVVKLYWFKHNCKIGQYSAAKVHGSVSAELKDGVDYPKSIDDYKIYYDHSLEDLEVEEIAGL